MSSTQISPQQALLSTIYKQSWHPVASTKCAVPRGPKRPKEAAWYAGDLQRIPPCRQGNDRRYERLRDMKRISIAARSSKHAANSRNGPRPHVPKATSITIFTTTSINSDPQTLNSNPPSLSSWKRQLKTCVESNNRVDSAKPERGSAKTNDRGKTLKERLSPAWPPDSSATFYKVLNYQNHTLSSICVQGKDPPTKSLSGSAIRAKSNPTLTSSISSSLDQTESVSMTTSVDVNDASMTSEDNENPLRCTHFNVESGKDDLDNVNNNLDKEDLYLNNLSRNHNSEIDMDDEKDLMPNLNSIKLNFSKDDSDADVNSGDDSDISEQEMFSEEEEDEDDEEDEESIHTNFRIKAGNSRLFIEKCKELYKNENHSSSSLQTQSEINDSNTFYQSKNVKKDTFPDNNKPANNVEVYQFAPVLPKKLEKYNLSELAALPYDVNWRAIVRPSDLYPDDRLGSKKSYVAKQRFARSARILNERNRMETLIDRLLVLEKLQVSTKQSESMARYHVAHVRAAAAKQKAQRAKSPPLTSSITNDNKTDDVTAVEPNPRTPSRRRSLVSNSSARLAWANEMTKGQQTVLKEAHRSGDFSVVLDDWSAKNRPAKGGGERTRRFSESSRIGRRMRAPRFYEYHWSERPKEDKNRIPSRCWSSRARSCPMCRERWRKMNNNASQERRQRPSTAVCPSPGRPQSVSEKFFSRPTTQLSSRTAGSASVPTTLLVASCSQRRAIQSEPPSVECSTPTKDAGVVRTTMVPPETEHTVRSPQRQSIFTSAFKITSATFNKRP